MHLGMAAARLTRAYPDPMPDRTPVAAQLATLARTPLADLARRDTRAVLDRIVGKRQVVAPLDVAAFNSAI